MKIPLGAINKYQTLQLVLVFECTVKPVLTTTPEQRPPVYNGHLEPQFYKTDRNFIGANCE
jgi:hypothetical protein